MKGMVEEKTGQGGREAGVLAGIRNGDKWWQMQKPEKSREHLVETYCKIVLQEKDRGKEREKSDRDMPKVIQERNNTGKEISWRKTVRYLGYLKKSPIASVFPCLLH